MEIADSAQSARAILAAEIQDTQGGFSFDLHNRNAAILAAGGSAAQQLPKAWKTGTTIAGIAYRDGVVLGADTRATGGTEVVDKNCDKIHYLAPNIWCCGAGTAADTEKTTEIIASNLELLRLSSGSQSRVITALTLLKRLLYRYQGHVSAALVLGGVDLNGPHLYSVHPHGSTQRLPYTTMGSGSLAAMSVFESRYVEDLVEDAAILLVRDAIRAGIFNDLGSGSNVDVTVIRKGGDVSRFRTYENAAGSGADYRVKYPRPTKLNPSIGTTFIVEECFRPHKKSTSSVTDNSNMEFVDESLESSLFDFLTSELTKCNIPTKEILLNGRNTLFSAPELDETKLHLIFDTLRSVGANIGYVQVSGKEGGVKINRTGFDNDRFCRQGMGFLLTPTVFIFTNHIFMDKNGVVSSIDSFSNKFFLPLKPLNHTAVASSIKNGHNINKTSGPKDSVDLAFSEIESVDGLLGLYSIPSHSIVGKKVCTVGEEVVIFHVVSSVEVLKKHLSNGSSFVIVDQNDPDSVILAISIGEVTACEEDNLIKHTAFTTFGSSGSPVFSLNSGELIGMSFFRFDGFSYAERIESIYSELVAANPLLAAQQKVNIIENAEKNNRFDHHAFMDGARTGQMYSESILTSLSGSKAEVEKEKIKFNIPSRKLLLDHGDLIDDFVNDKDFKKRNVASNFENFIQTITFEKVSCYAYTNGDHSNICKIESMRFDKQNKVGVFAVQPNKRTGKFYACVIIESRLCELLSNYSFSDVEKELFVEKFREGMAKSFEKKIRWFLSYSSISKKFKLFDNKNDSDAFTTSDVKLTKEEFKEAQKAAKKLEATNAYAKNADAVEEAAKKSAEDQRCR